MAKSYFDPFNEVRHPNHPLNDWGLCFQWGAYVYDDGSRQEGYRFIWRRPNGSIQARPARIASVADIDLLTSLAKQAGWGLNQGP